MDDIKFIHTADIHLGRKFNYLGDKSQDAREHLFDILKKISQLAIDNKVKFLLISGDLFDSANPDLYTVGKFLDNVSYLGTHKIKVIVLPGTHDFLKENSVYMNKSLFSTYKNLYIFDDITKTSLTFQSPSITFYAYPPIANKMEISPIVGFNRDDSSKYHIIMAHGSVQIKGKSDPSDSPIELEEIKNSDVSYIALGHWHQNLDFTQGNVPCFYSGSPELIDIDQEKSGFVMLGNLTKGTYIPIKVGERYFDKLDIPVSEITSPEKIVEKILSGANINLIREVNLIGKKGKGIIGVNFNLLKDQIEKYFYHITIHDKTIVDIDSIMDLTSASSVDREYISILKGLIEKSKNEEEASMYKEALEIGYALLNGRSDIL
jgi:DNA repair exonuclease SbcCD nuclease subunit